MEDPIEMDKLLEFLCKDNEWIELQNKMFNEINPSEKTEYYINELNKIYERVTREISKSS